MARPSPMAGGALPALLCSCALLAFPGPLFPQAEKTDEAPAEAEDDLLLMEEAEGITVLGTRETTQDLKTITREDIERLQPPDLAALLQETLNMPITRYGPYGNQAELSLRGFDTERIAVLINGVPVNSSQSGGFELSQVDLASIERIEVISGGSDSKFNVSGALGGVINLITIREQPEGLRFRAAAANTAALPGSYEERGGSRNGPRWEDLADSQKFSLAADWGAKGFSLSGSLFANRAGNHFLYEDPVIETKIRRKTHNEVWDLGGSGSLIRPLGSRSSLLLSLTGYYGNKNIPPSGSAEIAGTEEDFVSRQSLLLDMGRFFRDDLSLEASLTHQWQTLSFSPPAGASSHHDEHLLTAITRWSWKVLPAFTLKAGGDFRFSGLSSTDMGSRTQQDGGLSLTGELQRGAFLLIPSVKAVFSDAAADTTVVPVPKLGLAWFPSERLTVKHNYFRSFKHPDFEDRYWPAGGDTEGNPDLKAEDGWGTDLGASFQAEGWSFGATGFAQYTSGSIHWAPGEDLVWRPANGGEAAFFGLEAAGDLELPLSLAPLGKLDLSLSYRFMLSYLLSAGYDLTSDKRIPYMPVHGASLSLGLPWKTGSLLITASFVGERYGETANITRLPPHLLLNLHVHQALSQTLTCFGELRNLLNARYESFDNYPMPGLTLTVGLRMNLAGTGAGGGGKG